MIARSALSSSSPAPAERLWGLTLRVEQVADRLATREWWLEGQSRVRRTMSERSNAGFLKPVAECSVPSTFSRTASARSQSGRAPANRVGSEQAREVVHALPQHRDARDHMTAGSPA